MEFNLHYHQINCINFDKKIMKILFQCNIQYRHSHLYNLITLNTDTVKYV